MLCGMCDLSTSDSCLAVIYQSYISWHTRTSIGLVKLCGRVMVNALSLMKY